MTDIIKQEIIKDEFTDASFVDSNARLPKIQPLRGTNDKTCGYFVSTSELANSAWYNFEPIADKLIDYSFEGSGNVEKGLLIPNPRMLVCVRSPLMGYDKQASQDAQQLVLLGQWTRDFKEMENVSNIQFYEVILLGKDNKPLHAIPFQYIAKGANGASFSMNWQQLVVEVTTCHAIANKVPARPKTAKFNSLCVFSFQTKREQVGQKQKSFTCRVVGHDVPKPEDWKNYFVGFDAETKNLVWDSLQPSLPLLSPTPTLALPESVDF
jgi:hypothetical protein